MTRTDSALGHHRGSRDVLAAIALLGVLLAACATPAAPSPPTPAPTAAASATPSTGSVLAGTAWALISLNGEDPPAATEITLRFEGETLGGSAGCNTYGGSYDLSDEGFQVSDLYATEMACVAPDGVVTQEQVYLDALRTVTGYQVTADGLTLSGADGGLRLVYARPQAPDASAVEVTATSIPDAAPTALPDPAASVGVRHVVDRASGVSLLVPVDWTVTAPGPEGGVTILQSYPEEKYVGGEGREPGDTKCDLTVHPPGTDVADVIEQVRADPMTTILSEQEIVLRSGRVGTQMELDSLGPARVLYAEIDDRAVVFICFGDLDPFAEIAATIGTEAGTE